MAVNRVIIAGDRESTAEARCLPSGTQVAATVGPTPTLRIQEEWRALGRVNPFDLVSYQNWCDWSADNGSKN